MFWKAAIIQHLLTGTENCLKREFTKKQILKIISIYLPLRLQKVTLHDEREFY